MRKHQTLELIQHHPLLTLQTPLGGIPDYWLVYIEPKIQRPQGTTCWLWEGSIDSEGYPTVPWFEDGVRLPTRRRASRALGGLFWTLHKDHRVWNICGNMLCVNPSHFVVSDTHSSLKVKWAMQKRFRAGLYKQRNRP